MSADVAALQAAHDECRAEYLRNAEDPSLIPVDRLLRACALARELYQHDVALQAAKATAA